MEERWYYIFDIGYYDEFENFEERKERGLICARCKSDVASILETWYGGDGDDGNIYSMEIYDVNMDTNEILFERNFPGLIDLVENPIE